MTTLKEYLTKNKLSQSAFAKIADLDQAQVSRYLSGITLPNIEAAYKIYRASRKAVKMEAWIDDKLKSKRYR